ncbi:putative oxidoreductase [Xylariomycetidae sp. FL2044]|nr:putative oxidoreductase [Xylariomycetidae sp. FL2044]
MPHKQEQNEGGGEGGEEEALEFTPDLYPPFPESLPTVPLETISLAKLLLASDDSDSDSDPDAAATTAAEEEQDRVFAACRSRGFFYLDLSACAAGATLLALSADIARTVEKVFRLPLAEKLRYRQGGGSLAGYKVAGASVTDSRGTRDTAEFFNVGKDDMLIGGDDENDDDPDPDPDPGVKKEEKDKEKKKKMARPWPREVLDKRPMFEEYMRTAHGVGMRILTVLAARLGIAPEEMLGRHRIEEPSGDHVRVTRGPARETEEMPEIQTPSHTDFGTVTILMNWLGGLQVWSTSARLARLARHEPDPDLEPGEWLWVRPRPGCAIVNLGDAAVKYSGGVLCSGRHRVVPAPGAQGRWTRYSVVYFVRPEDGSVMGRLVGKEGKWREDGEEDGEDGEEDGEDGEGEEEEKGLRAKEWIIRQAAGLGIDVAEKEENKGQSVE